MSIDQENSLDGVVDWIEEKFGGERETDVKPCPEKKNAGVPVPDIRAVIKPTIMTEGDRLQEAVDCMRQLLITARYQISQLEEKNKKLETRVESDSVVRCPACCFAHKTKGNRFFPSYIKAIQSKCTLELTFKTKEDLLSFMLASQLDSDENGVPVLTPAIKPVPRGLGEAGSQLTNLLLEKEKENAKVKIALPKKDEVVPAQLPVDFVVPLENTIQQPLPMLRRSPRKLGPMTNWSRTPERSGKVEQTGGRNNKINECRSADRRMTTERPARNNHETSRSPLSTRNPPRASKHTSRGMSFSFNSHMISSREDNVQPAAAKSRSPFHGRLVERNVTEETSCRRERDGHRRREDEERTRTGQYRRETAKRRCSPEREEYRSNRRWTPGREQRRARDERGWRMKSDERRRNAREDSRIWEDLKREANERERSLRRVSPETRGPPAPLVLKKEKYREKQERVKAVHLPNGLDLNTKPTHESTTSEKQLVNTPRVSSPSATPKTTRLPDDDLSDGELMDDENEEVDSDCADGGNENQVDEHVATPEDSPDHKSAEDDLTEDENMDWFGEVVSDDNDVLGEDYESGPEDNEG